jgi:hypothetical protein
MCFWDNLFLMWIKVSNKGYLFFKKRKIINDFLNQTFLFKKSGKTNCKFIFGILYFKLCGLICTGGRFAG